MLGGLQARKDYMLLHAIQAFGTIPGKKAFHKINYFANLDTDLFVYGWRNWGPFSPEIQQFYDDAYSRGLITVKKQDLQKPAVQYNISLAERGMRILENLKGNETIDAGKINQAVDSARMLLVGKIPREMEILASVHYVYTYGDERPDAKAIWEVINELKPKAGFTMEDVARALSELKEKYL